MTTVTPQGSEMMINYFIFSRRARGVLHLSELTGWVAVTNAELCSTVPMHKLCLHVSASHTSQDKISETGIILPPWLKLSKSWKL